MNHPFHAGNAWERKIAELETDIDRLKVELELSGSSETRLEAEISRLRAVLANVYGELLGEPGEAAEAVRAMIRKALADETGKARAAIRDALNAPRR